MRGVAIGIGAVLAVALLSLYSAAFVVHQTQQALVLQFGNLVRQVRDPGLHLRIPFIQQVEFFDRRVLDFDAPSVELVLGDQKRLVVDAFARYRIADALRFRQSAGSEANFRTRLEPVIFSALRSVLGEESLFAVLSEDRNAIMGRIRTEVNRALDRFGVEVVDVRIKRADLPSENSQAIFRRMQTERQREASELRAQGAEIGSRIRARADRERRVILAEAERQSQVLRGEGDAEAIRIFAEAFSRDVDFFSFYRSMQAYRTALADGTTSLVLSPDNEFFRYFDDLAPRGGPGGPADPGSGLAQGAPRRPLPLAVGEGPAPPRPAE
jgi:membrane protease subunit HflC